MTEQRLWHMVKKGLAHKGGKWMRVENPCLPGTPDVFYCVEGIVGWLELKELETWPVREHTPVTIQHYTKEQRLWIWDYADNNGTVHVLLRIARPKTYLLFDSDFSYHKLGYATREICEAEAVVCGGPALPCAAIIEALRLPLI